MAETVWVVDDDEQVRDVLGAMLKELGYEVRLFSQAAEVLADYAIKPPDITVVDLRMPGMNGVELTRALLAKDPKAIVVILTGYPSITDAVEAMRSGAADFISKPCSAGELNLRIMRVLERRRLEYSLKRIRLVLWTLLETLPIWIILGMLLARFLK